MFRAIGIDLGSKGTRKVSVGLFWGNPQKENTNAISGPQITNIPSDRLTFRSLNVPAASRDIQSRVIREELAFTLPFPAEEASWDWVETDDIASVVVVPTSQVQEIREKVGPSVRLDAEPYSYLRLCRFCGYEEALVIDFGASRTTVCAIKDRAIDWVRVSFKGGDYLTNAIAKANQISLEEAEERKKDLGIKDPECEKWLSGLLESSLLTKPIPFENVFICGGGGAMPGLLEELSSLLGQKAVLFPLPSSLDPLTDAAAFGAALAAKFRWPSVRLAPAEPENKQVKYAYLVWLLILLSIATVDLEVRKATAVNTHNLQTDVITQAVNAQAPELKSIPQEKLAEELAKRVENAQDARQKSPEKLLEVLAKLAKPLVSLDQFEIRSVESKTDTNNSVLIHLEGQAKGVQDVETFRKDSESVLENPELIQNRAGASGTSRFTLEGVVPKQ